MKILILQPKQAIQSESQIDDSTLQLLEYLRVVCEDVEFVKKVKMPKQR